MKTPRHISLVGLMGSGKSALAQIIASDSHRTAIDTDHLVEEDSGMSIPEIFAAEGEAGFRTREHQAIRKALDYQSPAIISTGGGAVETEANLQALLNESYLVFLRCPPEVVYERVKGDSNRPLLKDPDPLGVLQRLAERRTPLYAQAHLTVRTDQWDVQECFKQIEQGFREFRSFKQA